MKEGGERVSGTRRETENATLLTEDRGRGRKPRDAGGLQALTKARDIFSPGVFGRHIALLTP